MCYILAPFKFGVVLRGIIILYRVVVDKKNKQTIGKMYSALRNSMFSLLFILLRKLFNFKLMSY